MIGAPLLPPNQSRLKAELIGIREGVREALVLLLDEDWDELARAIADITETADELHAYKYYIDGIA
jgi:hypothetical protein